MQGILASGQRAWVGPLSHRQTKRSPLPSHSESSCPNVHLNGPLGEIVTLLATEGSVSGIEAGVAY